MSKPSPLPAPDHSPSRKGKWQGYLLLWMLLNAGIWSSAMLFLKKSKPTYVSEWALILPGTGPGVNVNLPDIGQASSSSSSPFGGPSSDPRANYLFISTSPAVVEAAAKSLDIPAEDFGEPRGKLLENSTIMKYQVTGRSAEEAKKKSLALYDALVNRLNYLRVEEVSRRDEGVQNTLQNAQQKLRAAQQRLSDFKLQSGLSFQGQVDNLSVNVEQLRRQKSEILAQRQQVTMKLQQLSASLGVTPQQAANAFVLQADQQFQQHLKDASEATANLTVFLAKWGDNHPTVVKERSRQQAAQASLFTRAQALLGQSLDARSLEILQLASSDPSRSSLFHDLVATQAEAQGLNAQAQSIDSQTQQLDQRLNGLAQSQSTLENLKRDMQTAEAVFASTLATIDLSKSDIFAAYPMVQMLAEPSLPKKASGPNKSLVMIGAGIGSIFTGAAFLLMYFRRRLLALAKKKKEAERLALAPADTPGSMPPDSTQS